MRCKLANIVLDTGDFLRGQENLLYRVQGAPGIAQANYAQETLSFAGVLDLLTYFNALSLAKWRQYTAIDNVWLHVELQGSDCDMGLARVNAAGHIQREVVANMYESTTWQAFDIPIALDDAILVGLVLASAGTTLVRNGYYFTETEGVRPVRLALSTTTFKKEDFIVPNIARIRAGIIESGEAVAEGFHMFVVDNGQTLNVQALSGSGVSVLPNCNAGGAGGFARGMMEALKGSFTHIILMDDDVRIFPESIKRVHALLSLVTEEYVQAGISGAMIEMERPALFFEDVSQMSVRGSWEKIKPSIWVDTPEGVARCESIDTELENTYAGWWFCCMPMALVRAHGLPLPFFVRLDDVEYGLRCHTKFMTMAGICVWHAGFDARYNAVVACYQYVRNMLVVSALHNWAHMRVVMFRYWRLFHIFLRNLDYASAELWLDGLEDYLRGPDYLAAREPFEAMAAALAKAEAVINLNSEDALAALSDADAHLLSELEINLDWINGEDTRPLWRKVLPIVPHDRHWFPKRMLRENAAMVNYDPGMSFVPWAKTALRSSLVAISPDGQRASIRRIDHARYKQLVARYKKVRKEFSKRAEQVAQQWREAAPYLTSQEFWENYLGLKEDGAFRR